MKIGYGAMSGMLYLITGPSKANPANLREFSCIRLNDGHIGPHTSLVNVREFAIKDLLEIVPYKFNNKEYLLQIIKELVQ